MQAIELQHCRIICASQMTVDDIKYDINSELFFNTEGWDGEAR